MGKLAYLQAQPSTVSHATLLRILCTLPVTMCSAERSLSGLKCKDAIQVSDDTVRLP